MATVHAQFSYTVEDELGTKASLALYGTVDDTTTVADLAVQWQDYSTALTAVTDGIITGGTARLILSPTASQAGKPAAGARVEQNGVINYLVTASGRRFGIAAPAWKDSLLSGDSLVIGTGAGATWQAILTGAMGDATGTNASNDYLALGAAVDSFLSFRKHRKQLTRASFAVE
jgi:hypothetical protein